jgi:antitoxin MazE
MHRKVFRTGNSIVVSLPREALDLLGIGEGSEVSLDLDKELRQLVISVPEPGPATEIDEEFARQVSNFIDRYRQVLEALSK